MRGMGVRERRARSYRYDRGRNVRSAGEANRRAATGAGPGSGRVAVWPRSSIGASPVVRRIVARWRGLTADAKGSITLIACSGGADSIALALALRSATGRLAIGHVVHELRTRGEELADRDRVRALAARLGVPFFEDEIAPPARGNMEANARRLRYGALTAIAVKAGAVFVATGHHADDQLESVTLALVRGAGPAGLSGVAPRRALARGVALVRPMLGVTRAEAQGVCRAAGVEWSEDRTNADARRARAKIRGEIGPRLEALRPGAAGRAARSADLLRDAAGLVRDRAREVFGETAAWPRARLRTERAIVVGEGVRAAITRAGAGADRLSARVTDPIVRAIRDRSTEPREFIVGSGAGRITVRVTAREVSVRGGSAPGAV